MSTSPDPYVVLADELWRLGRQLDAMGAQLRMLRASQAAQQVARAVAPPQARPAPVRSAAPPAPSTRRPTQISGARLLAWTGGGVTLLGVVLLLVLAASRGWFSPQARIAAGSLLGIGLVAFGWWLHRTETARTGAVAVAATGFATLYLVVAAASAVYGYVDPVPAIAVALVVAAAGLGVADLWRSQLLACGATVGAALLAPALVQGWLLVALVLALQVAALPVVLRRRWSWLTLVAAAGPVFYGISVVVGERESSAMLALAVLAVALGTVVPAARLLPPRTVGALVAAAPMPALVAAPTVGGWGGGALAAGAAIALGALAAVPGTERTIRLVAASAAAVAMFEGAAVALEGSTLTLVALGQSIVAAVLAASLRSRFALVVGLAYGAVGALIAVVRDAPLAALVVFAGPGSASVTGVAVSAMVLGGAVASFVAAGRVGWSSGLWVPVGLTGLYGAAGVVITSALLVSPDRAGFTTGHALVTVSWTVAALVLLARGISEPAPRVAGLVLVAAAVAKLVLFDLVALDGLARVAAFLGAGLVLLAAGTRYARLVTEAERS